MAELHKQFNYLFEKEVFMWVKSFLLLVLCAIASTLFNSYVNAQEDIGGEKAECDVRWGIKQGLYDCRYKG